MTAIAAAGQQLRKRSARYNFAQTPLTKAVKELYRNGQSEIIQNRDSYSRIIQSDGSVKTFNPNDVAFVEGEGVINLDEGVEYSKYTEFPSNLSTAKGTVSNYGSDDTFTITSPDNGSSSNGINLTQDIPAGIDTTFIADFYAGTTDLTRIGAYFNAQAWTPSTATVTVEVVSGPGSLLLVAGTSLFQLSSLDSVTPTRLRIKVAGSDIVYSIINYTEGTEVTTGKSLQIGKYVQCRKGLHDELLDVIFATTTPATRLKDNTQISTFLEKGVWQDASAGISGSAGAISLIGTKYEGLGVAAFINAQLRNPDSTFSTITAASANSVTVDNDVQAGAVLDLTVSDYWTGDFTTDTAAVSALRTAAGDDVSAIPEAKLWSLNDFEASITIKFLQSPSELSGFPRIISFYEASNFRTQLVISSVDPSRVVWQNIDPTLGANASEFYLPADIVKGDVITFVLKKSSTDGVTIKVGNQEDNNANAINDLPTINHVSLGNDDLGINALPCVIKDFRVRSL